MPGPRRLAELAWASISQTRGRLRERDLLLNAAGLTFFGALGLLPLLVIGLRLASALFGADAVRETGAALARFTPSKLGASDAIRQLADAAARVGWASVLAAVLPASLYSEGLVRSLGRISQRARRPTVRGRTLTAALVAVVALGGVIVVGALRPVAQADFGTGTPARLLGLLVSFVALWLGFSAVLCLLYQVFPARRLEAAPLIVGAAATGSWLAGQTLGFLLVLRLAVGAGTAYGGSVLAGAVATVLFLLYLDNIVLIGGYALTLSLADMVRDAKDSSGTARRSVSAKPSRPGPQPPAGDLRPAEPAEAS